MPYKTIKPGDEIDRIVKETDNADRDADLDAVRDMYVTPENAIGMVVKLALHWGHAFCEVTDVDFEEEAITLEELFTGEQHVTDIDKALDVPFIGQEYTVKWIEARVDGEWERVSDYDTLKNPLGGNIPRGESYENTRQVEKTYKHGLDEFDTWRITVDQNTQNPEVFLDSDAVTNPEVLEGLLDSVVLPDNFDLSRLTIGTLYTKERYVGGEDGREQKHEIVWWTVKSQFEENTGRNRFSPVTELDRPAV